MWEFYLYFMYANLYSSDATTIVKRNYVQVKVHVEVLNSPVFKNVE